MEILFNRVLWVSHGIYRIEGWEIDFLTMSAYASNELRLREYLRCEKKLSLVNLAWHELKITKGYRVDAWWPSQKKWHAAFGIDSDLSQLVNKCYKHFIDDIFEHQYLGK